MSRRVTRLENDTESIYELITDVSSTQGEHTARLGQIESTLGEHTARLGRIESTQGEHTARFDRIESTLNEVVRRLPDPSSP